MKMNGFHVSTTGKRVVAASLAVALVLAAISIVSAFAAPAPQSASRAFGSHLHDLDADRVWYNNAIADAANFTKTSNRTEAEQYLSQYAFALRQAESIVAGHGTISDLAKWLHEMRGLRDKLVAIGFSSSSSSVAGAGLPVTGGSSSSSSSSSSSATSTPAATATSSSSSSSSSSATSTPTSGTSSSSSSTDTPTPTPTFTPTATPTSGG